MKLGVFSLLIVASVLLSCDNKTAGSQTIEGRSPVPDLLQIAKDTLPKTTIRWSTPSFFPNRMIQSVDFNPEELVSRFFSTGTTDFLYRLELIDYRLDEVATRVANCATNPTQLYFPPAFVNELSFPMHFSCVSSVTQLPSGASNFKLYFGKDKGYWYLAELSNNSEYSQGKVNPPSLATLAKVKDDGLEMELWHVSVEHKESPAASVVHVIANKTTGEFSLAIGSNADETETISDGTHFEGLGCGIQIITNGSTVYGYGQFSQERLCSPETSVCMAAKGSSGPDCTSLSKSSSLVPVINRAKVSGAEAQSLIIARTGLPEFK